MTDAKRPDVRTRPAITAEDLPPADTRRWVIRRKAAVVAGVQTGLITLEEACRRYALSVDEFNTWARNLDAHGLTGLKTTQIRRFRGRP
ncbi:MAG: DUF1153 domain-containing protein [Rhodospirillales bacterium]